MTMSEVEPFRFCLTFLLRRLARTFQIFLFFLLFQFFIFLFFYLDRRLLMKPIGLSRLQMM